MEIKAFKAYRFNKQVVGNPGDCVAPPYDVIDDEQQAHLYDKSDYNTVRIIKGRTEPGDNSDHNCYTRAAEFFNSWITSGALKQDTGESIYAYVQDFELAGAWFQRISFVALGKLEPFGKTVRAHEQTMLGPRQDRLNLKKATAARFGLVYMLYEDAENTAERIIQKQISDQPLVDLTDEQNVRHRLFTITDGAQIKAITEMMASKSCIIADGHHRYETGLAYAELSGNPEARYQMLAFTNTLHRGLIVLATHRVINNLDNFSLENLLRSLQSNFELTRYDFVTPTSARDARHRMLAKMKADHGKDRNAFGIYGGDRAFYVATLKDAQAMNAAAPDMSTAWQRLDVAVLSKLVLEPILGIDEQSRAKGENVEYVKDSGNKAKELVQQVDTRKKQVVFFMNPPKIKQIQEVADAGERMPQKSTYFYPKVFSGLTIQKL